MANDPFEELSQAAERNPDDPWVWLRLANAFLESGGTPIAKHVLARACGCAGNDPKVWSQIGELCELCEDDAGALAAYRQAAEGSPGSMDAEIGLVLLRLGQPTEAEQSLRMALARTPKSVELCFALARSLVDQARFTEARQILDRGPSAACEDPVHLVLLATIARQLRDGAGELAALRKIRALRPDDPQPALDLAQALVESGDAEGARRELESLAADPKIHLFAGRLMMRCELPLAAAHHLERVVAARPSAEAYRELARAFEAAGRWKDAVASFEKALMLGGDEPAALFGLGRSLAADRRLREASTILVRAAALAPDDEGIREALTRVLTGREPKPRTNSGLHGDLDLFSVPELLEFLAVQHATGVLDVTSPRGSAQVRLLEGRMLQASWQGGETLAEVLVTLGLVDPGAIEGTDNAIVIRRIADQQLVPLEVLRTVLASQIVDGLIQIIGLRDGRASFAKTPPPSSPIDPELLVDPRFALLEATRRMDEINGRTRS